MLALLIYNADNISAAISFPIKDSEGTYEDILNSISSELERPDVVDYVINENELQIELFEECDYQIKEVLIEDCEVIYVFEYGNKQVSFKYCEIDLIGSFSPIKKKKEKK